MFIYCRPRQLPLSLLKHGIRRYSVFLSTSRSDKGKSAFQTFSSLHRFRHQGMSFQTFAAPWVNIGSKVFRVA